MKKPSAPRPLVEAAEKLDAALTRHNKATRELVHLTLDSRRDLLRAEEIIQRIAEHDVEMANDMQEFQAAVQEVAAAQQKDAEQVKTRAQMVSERRAELKALDVRLTMTMEAVKAIREVIESVRGLGAVGGVGADFNDELTKLIELVQSVNDDARQHGFEDVATDTHTLRQQLESIEHRAQELEQRIPRA